MTTETRALNRRYAIAAGALVLIVLVTAWIGRVSEGRRSITLSDAAYERGDRVEAIVQARAAVGARCPFCASPEIGYTRLQAIAKDAEGRGDDPTAVAAWRAVRAATLGTVAFLDSSGGERRDRADAEIARLEHRIDAAAVAAAGGATASPAASEEKLRIALAQNHMPSSMVFVMIAIGGALFLAFAIRFVRASAGVTDAIASAAGAALSVVAALLF